MNYESIRDLNLLEKGMVAAAAITGILHVYAGISFNFNLLTLAGLGFIGGIGAFLSGKYTNLIVAASIPYTGSQFFFYYFFYGLNISGLAAVDKVVQLGLMIFATEFVRRRWEEKESLRRLLKA